MNERGEDCYGYLVAQIGKSRMARILESCIGYPAMLLVIASNVNIAVPG